MKLPLLDNLSFDTKTNMLLWFTQAYSKKYPDNVTHLTLNTKAKRLVGFKQDMTVAEQLEELWGLSYGALLKYGALPLDDATIIRLLDKFIVV